MPTFGIGAGLTFTPVVAILAAVHGLDTLSDPNHFDILARAAQFTAAGLVAGTAILIHSTAWTLTRSRKDAAVVTAAYAIGSSAWSTSAKMLWQHAPAGFYLTLAMWAYIRCARSPRPRSLRFAALCGISLALAVVTRPTTAGGVLIIGISMVLARQWTQVVCFVMAGAPIGVMWLMYNYSLFGSPFVTGQSLISQQIAQAKTGSSNVWQGAVVDGLGMLLFSPSRGLFILSPWTIASVVGAWRAYWVVGDLAPAGGALALAPWAGVVVTQIALASKWYDSWGGWCYGYRPIVDTTPVLALLLVPVLPELRTNCTRGWLLRKLLYTALLFAAAVQAIGAWR